MFREFTLLNLGKLGEQIFEYDFAVLEG